MKDFEEIGITIRKDTNGTYSVNVVSLLNGRVLHTEQVEQGRTLASALRLTAIAFDSVNTKLSRREYKFHEPA